MKLPFEKGLYEIAAGHYAWLQPDGSWGYSNAGLVVDGEASLLVDTLFDERLTAEMLAAMKDATGIGGADVTTLLNTHANGDHTYGNGLVTRAEIIASEASAKEMDEVPPERMAELVKMAPQMGDLGAFFLGLFGAFEIAGVKMRYPTRTFSGRLDLQVGDKAVQLIEVGPAHTAGDVLVWVPGDRVLYTGDILFIDGTPLMWAGPVQNWIAACDRILSLDADAIVPGHGPITDADGVRRMQGYLRHIDREARQRFDAGLSVADAAFDIDLGEYADWPDAERLGANVDALYRGYRGGSAEGGPDVAALFGLMMRLRNERGLGRRRGATVP